jgi:C-terminal processing protease CtpA/Prc
LLPLFWPGTCANTYMPVTMQAEALTVRGIYCSAVGADSAAEKAGIMTGDIIVRVDGRECCDVLQFKSSVARTLAWCGSVVMRINRNGMEMSRRVVHVDDDLRDAERNAANRSCRDSSPWWAGGDCRVAVVAHSSPNPACRTPSPHPSGTHRAVHPSLPTD